MDFAEMTMADLEKEHQARDMEVQRLRGEQLYIHQAIVAKEIEAERLKPRDPRLSQTLRAPDTDVETWLKSLPGETFGRIKGFFTLGDKDNG